MAGIRVGIAQANPVVGDVRGNVAKALRACEAARRKGADLVVFPECWLCGYPPDDLVYHDSFVLACRRGVEDLSRGIPEGLSAVVGTVWGERGRLHNAACVVGRGRVGPVYFKRELPNYGVFDEKRYFAPGTEPLCWTVNGLRVGALVCEDLAAGGEAVASLARQVPDVVVVLNASPYYLGKEASRYHWGVGAAGHLNSHLVYVNMVGGQDEHVYDGTSFVVDPDCRLVRVLPSFEEAVEVVDIDPGRELPEVELPSERPPRTLRRALAVGVRDYVEKSGFKGALLGLSGGIDSAVTLAVAVDALGAERVVGVTMPSRFTSAMSVEDAAALAANLGVRTVDLPIDGVHRAMTETLAGAFAGAGEDVTEENIQARIRGNLLMALSNKWGHIVLSTGNKSEFACGYCTLYGDMAGGFAVLKDVAKGMVYDIAAEFNREREAIPRRIIDRPPSAELRPDQTDQDSLPPYETIDAVVAAYMERMEDHPKIVRENGPRAREVLAMLDRSEYKRRQAPPGITVTRRAFGKDWRMPICKRWSVVD